MFVRFLRQDLEVKEVLSYLPIRSIGFHVSDRSFKVSVYIKWEDLMSALSSFFMILFHLPEIP